MASAPPDYLDYLLTDSAIQAWRSDSPPLSNHPSRSITPPPSNHASRSGTPFPPASTPSSLAPPAKSAARAPTRYPQPPQALEAHPSTLQPPVSAIIETPTSSNALTTARNIATNALPEVRNNATETAQQALTTILRSLSSPQRVAVHYALPIGGLTMAGPLMGILGVGGMMGSTLVFLATALSRFHLRNLTTRDFYALLGAAGLHNIWAQIISLVGFMSYNNLFGPLPTSASHSLLSLALSTTSLHTPLLCLGLSSLAHIINTTTTTLLGSPSAVNTIRTFHTLQTLRLTSLRALSYHLQAYTIQHLLSWCSNRWWIRYLTLTTRSQAKRVAHITHSTVTTIIEVASEGPTGIAKRGKKGALAVLRRWMNPWAWRRVVVSKVEKARKDVERLEEWEMLDVDGDGEEYLKEEEVEDGYVLLGKEGTSAVQGVEGSVQQVVETPIPTVNGGLAASLSWAIVEEDYVCIDMFPTEQAPEADHGRDIRGAGPSAPLQGVAHDLVLNSDAVWG